MAAPLNDVASTSQSSTIFGGAKPRDEKEWEERQKREESDAGSTASG